MARTERPSATIRSASCSWASPSSRPSSARAWPADSTPAATRRCTGAGRFSRRIVLEIWGRLRPIRLRELLVRRAELVQQLLVRGRLFERVQVGAVDVLEQRVPQHRVVAGVPDDRRDGLLADGLGGPPAALAHDQFVAAVADVADDDRLEEADLLDRGLQLLERLLVEDVPRLLGVRLDRRRPAARRSARRAPARARSDSAIGRSRLVVRRRRRRRMARTMAAARPAQ